MEIRVTTYAELDKWNNAFASGSFGLYVLVGPPGVAKSYNLKRLMAKPQASKPSGEMGITEDGRVRPLDHIAQPLYLEGGSLSAFKLYQMLFKHLDETIIMDDIDSAVTDRNLVRLLKAVCQTEKLKTIGWHTSTKILENDGIPTAFATRSRACIICNRWETVSEHVESLVSRGIMVKFEPSVVEVHNYVVSNKIVSDREILAFIKTNAWMISSLDIRHLLNAVEAKKAGLNWKQALSESMRIVDLLIVDRLDGEKHATGEARCMKFMKETGQSRPMYFKAVSILRELKQRRTA